MEKIKVRVTKAKSPFFWYNRVIGQTFEVTQDKEKKDAYLTGDISCLKLTVSGMPLVTGLIEKCDCEIV